MDARAGATAQAGAHEATGTIVAIDGEFAIVRMDEGGCGRCHEPGGCGGSANIGRMFCGTTRDYRALNPGRVPVGASVRISIADGAVRRSATVAYGIPLLALFAGALAGASFAGDPGSMLGAGGGLLVGWWLLRRDRRSAERDPALLPVVSAVLRTTGT